MPRLVIGRAGGLGAWLRSQHGMVLAGVVVPTLVVAGTLWLILGGGSHRDAPAPATAGSSSAAATDPAASGASPGRSGGVASGGASGQSSVPGTPSPGAGSEDASSGFLAEVGAINPALVGDPVRALAAGRATCQDVRDQKTEDALADAVIAHFRVPDLAITKTTALLLVDASRNHLCPS